MEKYNMNKLEGSVFQWDLTCLDETGQERMIFFSNNGFGDDAAYVLLRALCEKGVVDIHAKWWYIDDRDIPVAKDGTWDNFIGVRSNGVVVVTGPMVVQHREFLENFAVKVA